MTDAFEAAGALAAEVARIGRKAGRYEITVTAVVRETAPDEGRLEHVDYHWEWFAAEHAPGTGPLQPGETREWGNGSSTHMHVAQGICSCSENIMGPGRTGTPVGQGGTGR